MALTARNEYLLAVDQELRIPVNEDHGSCDLAHDLGSGPAYNQEAFRYFLSNERKRSENANRPFLLLLVDVQQAQRNGGMEPTVATKLFDGLFGSLRDTDVIGWYHEGRVAGAVLTHVEADASANVSGEIRERVTTVLRRRLPADAASRLQVRVYELPAGIQ